MQSQILSIQEKLPTLSNSLEFHKHLFAAQFLYPEMLAIPDNRIGMLFDGYSESLIFVEGMGQRNLLPTAIFKVRLLCLWKVTHLQAPFTVKIILLALCRITVYREKDHQQKGK